MISPQKVKRIICKIFILINEKGKNQMSVREKLKRIDMSKMDWFSYSQSVSCNQQHFQGLSICIYKCKKPFSDMSFETQPQWPQTAKQRLGGRGSPVGDPADPVAGIAVAWTEAGSWTGISGSVCSPTAATTLKLSGSWAGHGVLPGPSGSPFKLLLLLLPVLPPGFHWLPHCVLVAPFSGQ